MEDLRNAHDVVAEHMPAKDAPDSEWAAHHRWAADFYETRGEPYHAEKERHRIAFYENP